MVDNKLPKATHESNLSIGNITLKVAVLEDGTRVITRNGIFQAFKRTQRGRALADKRVSGLPSFIDARNIQPFIDDDLRRELTEFEYVSKSGKVVRRGYKAEILPEICDVYLRAREDGNVLTPQQAPLALQAEILTRSLAKLGIVALIDEATGYQAEREVDELQKLLSAYIADEFLPYQERFPSEFYKQIYRLRGWKWPPKKNHTQYVGKLTNQIVYDLLPDGVLTELRRKNPIDPSKGYRAHRHHQFLTIDIGNPHLEKHLSQLIVLMRISKDWEEFDGHMLEAFEKYGSQTKLHLSIPKEDTKVSSSKKLKKFLDSGGRSGAEDDFDRALRRASKPE